MDEQFGSNIWYIIESVLISKPGSWMIQEYPLQNIFDSGWLWVPGVQVTGNLYRPVFDFVKTAGFVTTFVAKLIFSNFLF
ncbi:unnamed protein product [Rhizophagus irregularis]|nr:unnamed protein product [Rhizophagus irregularis]